MNKPQRKKDLEAIAKLLDIIDELRVKCPWDQKQSFESLRTLTIEETYELADAILQRNDKEMEKELGDLLLHIVFYAKIGSEKKMFNWASICEKICQKLIHRHPHIYGNAEAKDATAVKKTWEKLKLKEGRTSILEGVPKSLPALVKAHRIQEKASDAGFDWDESSKVYEKVKEELSELQEAVSKKNIDAIEDEMGDVFFSLVNYARFLRVNADDALARTNEKFIRRFRYIEENLAQKNTSIQKATTTEMENLWKKAKTALKTKK